MFTSEIDYYRYLRALGDEFKQISREMFVDVLRKYWRKLLVGGVNVIFTAKESDGYSISRTFYYHLGFFSIYSIDPPGLRSPGCMEKYSNVYPGYWQTRFPTKAADKLAAHQ